MRKIALKVLNEYEANKAYINLLLKEYLKADMDSRDRGLITEIVYGVVRNKRYLDFRIAAFSTTKIKKISIPLLNILRMGFYQFDFMDKVPNFAVIHESVKLAEKFCYKSKGMVNGILRNAQGQPVPEPLPTQVTYSFTDEMYALILEQYGDKTEEILIHLNKKQPVVIRPNLLKTTIDTLSAAFPEAEKTEDSLVLSHMNVSDNPLFLSGDFSVQGLSSQAAVHVLAPKENEKILDACAAPGGKTVFIGEKMKNTGELLAVEFHAHRCRLIEQNLKRCGISNAQVLNEDARKLAGYEGYFDRILLDVPCSGLGVIGSKPDIKWQDFDFPALIDMQYELLQHCAGLLKKGGTLVYATCTINKNENIAQIKKFLSRNTHFRLEPFSIHIDTVSYGKDGYAEMMPGDVNTGFFIAKLVNIV